MVFHLTVHGLVNLVYGTTLKVVWIRLSGNAEEDWLATEICVDGVNHHLLTP